MSVDKFGRFSSSTNAPSSQCMRGPKGDGFTLTELGDYDIQYKRICNIGLPTENGDAVNLETLNSHSDKCLKLNDKKTYDVKASRLCNVGDAIDDGDAINKKSFKANTPIKLKDSYSVHQFRIQDIGPPKNDGDAINYLVLKNDALINYKGSFNAKHKKIINVQDPKSGQDCVNLRYLQTHSLVHKDNEYDARGRIIKNIALAKTNGDAINYAFLSDVLAEMSYAIHKNVKKGNQKLSKEEWKKKVTKSLYHCDWSELFGISENALLQPDTAIPTNNRVYYNIDNVQSHNK